MTHTYLDWAATALPDPDITATVARASMDYPGNPSSAHPMGRAAKSVLEDARTRCAQVLGCRAEQLAFTSGGTEANAMAILANLLPEVQGRALLSGMEHPSVSEPMATLGRWGWAVSTVNPEVDGRVDPQRIAGLQEPDKPARLAAVMGVNNEIGAIQDLNSIAAALRSRSKRPVVLHADLVQAVGKIPVDLAALDVDTASFSAHKIRGPRGVGLLYHRNPRFQPFIQGGGQEDGVRPGTENIAGALGLTQALEAHGSPSPTMRETGRWFLTELAALPGVRILPENRIQHAEFYVPNIVALTAPPIPGEVLARVLVEQGYAVSTGSACSHNKKSRISPTMRAMKIPLDSAAGMIRVSFGSTTSREELQGFLLTLKSAVANLHAAVRGG